MFKLRHPVGVVGDHHVQASYPDLAAVTGVDLYDGRGLTFHLDREDDIVRIPHTVRPHVEVWADYVEWELGLRMPNITFNDTPGACLNGPNRSRDVLVFKHGEWVVNNRPELAAHTRAVERFEQKNWFLSECGDADLPVRVAKTTFHSAGESPEFGEDPVWVKPSLGASGNGAHFCDTHEKFLRALKQIHAEEIAFQIQQHVNGEDTSVQFWFGDNGAELLMTTDQIMAGKQNNEHVGNICPSRFSDLLSFAAQAVADHFWKYGFRGYAGFDFRVHVAADGTITIYILEMNARITGGQYPGAMAGHLGFRQWRHIIVEDLRGGRIREPSGFMEHLRQNDMLWTRSKPHGVVPWYIGVLSVGKVMLLIPGTVEEQEQTLRAFRYLCC